MCVGAEQHVEAINFNGAMRIMTLDISVRGRVDVAGESTERRASI